MGSSVVGREATLEQTRHALAESQTVLLEGPPGIGKTAIFRDLVAGARASGWQVLSAEPAESERSLPYAALADLLRPLAHLVPELPAPQRVAVDVVLVTGHADGAFDERAVGAATRTLLELAVVEGRPALVAIDDAPWLDRPSEQALAFALRRLNRRPAVLLAARNENNEPAPIPLELDRSDVPVHRVPVAPLGVGALHHVLRAKLGRTFSRPLLSRIAADSGGNALLAIELARAVARLPELPRPGEDLPVALSVHQLLADQVATLPPDTRTAVRLASLLTIPTVADLLAAGIPAAALEPAEEAGVLVLGPVSIRFGHPLHAAAIRAGIPPGARRRLQLTLADAVTDLDERARQLARGVVEPNAAVAAELESAAGRQRARGAPGVAAELYERAAALTPTSQASDRGRRLVAALRSRFDSGDHIGVQATAAAADAELTGEWRAEALLLRATVAFVTVGHPPAVQFGSQALELVSPTSRMAGRIHAHLCVFQDSPEAAVRHGKAAVQLLREGNSDTELLCSAMLMLFYSEARAGLTPRTELLEEALALEETAPPWLGGTIPGLWWTAIDEHGRAQDRMRQHLRHAIAYGDEPLALEVLLHLIQCELLSGEWTQAGVHLMQARDLGEQLGTGLGEENYLQTVLAVYRGEFATIGPVVDEGLRRAEELDDSWGRRVYGGLSGQIALATGDYALAAETFGALAAALRSQGLAEPLATRLEPDWIEACVGVGDLDTAAVALEMLQGRHHRLPRPWTALALARSRVLLAAASGGNTVSVIESLTEARGAVPPEVLPLDRARCLLVAGMAHRRARRKREAREALTAAAAEFTALGAAGFAARANAELARVGARVTAALDLTATEERVARLAAQGRTNRVIAETLFISPKTVEANLARVYRKLGIATRAELGALMGRVVGEG